MKGAHHILVVVALLMVPVMAVLPLPVSGETYVGGYVTGTWSAADSPYVVTSNVVVPVNEALTIEPGVIVKFHDNMSLFVEGALVAVGTPTNPIVFTSNSSSPDRASWWFIQFNETSNDAASRVEHARIEYALHGLHLRETSIPIEHVTFYRNGDGIRLVGSDSLVQNNTFEDNWYGLYCTQGCHVVARDNTFTGNVDTSILVINATAEIVNNTIVDVDCGICLEQAHADIRSSWIENTHGGIVLSDQSSSTASNIRLTSIRTGVWLSDSSFNGRGITIDHGESGLFVISSSVRLEDSNIQDSSLYGIWSMNVTQTHTNLSDISLWNSSIINSTKADLRLGNGTHTDLYSTAFNRSSVVFSENATLGVHWYLNLRVENNHGDPISGASVNVSDSEGTFEVQLETDEAGGTDEFLLPEYEQNQSSTASHSPYRVLSQKWNHEDNETLVHLDRNKLVVLEQRILNEPPLVGLDYPLEGMWFSVGYPMHIKWVASDDHTSFEDLEFYVIYTCDGCDGGSVVGPLIGASAYNWTVPEVLKGHNVSISIIAVDEGGFSAVDQSGWVVIGEVTPLPGPIDGTGLILGIIFAVVLMIAILFILGRRRRGGETEPQTLPAETESRP
jgi:parallel beta-helix repeat protein